MTGPSSAVVALIVGTGTVTIGAMWQAVGYYARRFLTQQSNNHRDTLEALSGIRDIKAQLGPVKVRLDRIEAVGVLAGAVLGWVAMRRRWSGTL